MPIRIREIHIKATIVDEPVGSTSTTALSDTDKQKLIAACIEQIMRRLKLKEER